MEYTVQALAKLAGITPRTLHHYDQIGLLPPQRTTAAGYRIYAQPQVDRLQQILFYRALEMPLEEIRALLDTPGFDAGLALHRHVKLLREKRNRLTALIATAQKTIQTMEGEIIMTDAEKFEGFKKNLVDENERKYGAEVREKYGNESTDASNSRIMKMSEEDHKRFTALGEELNQALRLAAESKNPAGPLGQRAAALHKQWLGCTMGNYSPEIHAGLAEMYVADPRFRAYYENIVPGGAEFLKEAILLFINQP